MRTWTALVATALIAVGVCGPPFLFHGMPESRAMPADPLPLSRPGTAGMSLTLDGKPWWPIGLNTYQLGTNWKVNQGCGPQTDLDRYFGRLPPRSLTRVAVVANMAVNKVTARLDFSALDAVFAAAVRHHQLLIVVLAGDEGACENGFVKGPRLVRGRLAHRRFTWCADVFRPMAGYGRNTVGAFSRGRRLDGGR